VRGIAVRFRRIEQDTKDGFSGFGFAGGIALEVDAIVVVTE
jgi:hypothetical protein